MNIHFGAKYQIAASASQKLLVMTALTTHPDFADQFSVGILDQCEGGVLITVHSEDDKGDTFVRLEPHTTVSPYGPPLLASHVLAALEAGEFDVIRGQFNTLV